MDVRQLEQFVEVVRAGGFARAAKALHLSQPTLTRNIAALERSLGVALFSRTPKGATVTEAGRKLLPHATAVLSELDRAHAEFAEGRKDELGQVRLGASPNFLFDLIPEALAALAGRPEPLRFVVATGTYEQLTEGARNLDYDLVVCIIPDVSSHLSLRDVILEPIGQEVAVPVARAGHPLLDPAPDLARLATARWAVPHQLSLSYRFESAFFRNGLGPPNQRVNTASMPLLRRAILEWDLVGMLPLAFARSDLDAGLMVRLPTPELQLRYTVGLLTTQTTERDRATTLTAEAIRTAARALFAPDGAAG